LDYRVPPVKPDPDVPNWPDRIQTIALAEAHSWEDLVKRGMGLVEEAAQPDARIEAELASRLGPGPKSLAQLASLQQLVAREVRYVALEHGASAVIPRRAAQTLESRYGDCKDKVALFLALARGAGFVAWPVLVATARRDLERMRPPALGYFDHMIACARSPAGAQLCIDPTVAEAGLGELPDPLHGAVALDLREGVGAPRTLDAAPYGFDIGIEVSNTIGCDGAVGETLERRFGGPAAMAVRGMLLNSSEGDRLRWAEDDYRRTANEAARPTFAFQTLSNPSIPFSIRSTWTFPPVSSLETSDHFAGLDPWLLAYARGLKSENRHHPYPMRGLRLRSRHSFEICDRYQAGWHGPELDMRSEFGFLTRRYQIAPGRVEVLTQLELPRRTLQPAEIERFNRFVERALEQTPIRFGIGWSQNTREGE
jgi:hypothetical protein